MPPKEQRRKRDRNQTSPHHQEQEEDITQEQTIAPRRSTKRTSQGPAQENPHHQPTTTIPLAVSNLLAIDEQGVDIPENMIIDVINILPDIGETCRAMPREANTADKSFLISVLAKGDHQLQQQIPQSVGTLVAAIVRNIYYKDAPSSNLSQIRPIIAPYTKAVTTLRLPPTLQHAVETTTPPGLNHALDNMRQQALQLLRQETRDIIMGLTPQPTSNLAADGVRYPLIDILAPMLAAALSSVTNGTRITVNTARNILLGDDSIVEQLDSR